MRAGLAFRLCLNISEPDRTVMKFIRAFLNFTINPILFILSLMGRRTDIGICAIVKKGQKVSKIINFSH